MTRISEGIKTKPFHKNGGPQQSSGTTKIVKEKQNCRQCFCQQVNSHVQIGTSKTNCGSGVNKSVCTRKFQQDDTEKKSGRQTEKIGFPEGQTGSSLSTGTDNSKINEKYQTIFYTNISYLL